MTPRQQAIQSLIIQLKQGAILRSKDKIESWLIGDLIGEVRAAGLIIDTRHKSPAKKSPRWWENQAKRYAEYKYRGDK